MSKVVLMSGKMRRVIASLLVITHRMSQFLSEESIGYELVNGEK